MELIKNVVAVSLEIILIILLVMSGPKNKGITSKFFITFYEYISIIFVFYIFYKLLITHTYLKFEINGFNLILLIVLAMQFVVVMAVDVLRKEENILETEFRKSKYKALLSFIFIISIVSKTLLLLKIDSF